MAFFDHDVLEPDVVSAWIAPAMRLAEEEGHACVDFQHLLWVDLDSDEGLLGSAFDFDDSSARQGKLREFKDGVARLLARLPKGPGGARGYANELCAITAAFRELTAPAGSHLDRAVDGLRRRGEGARATRADLLGAVLDFRPHAVVSLISGDFGLAGELIQPGAPASVGGGQPASATLAGGDALEQFTTNLTELARQGGIGETIGRENEIRQLVKVLARRESNNPVLLGEAGVGKTKIVEGLALRLAHDDVHPRLRGASLLSLDMGLLVAGAQYRGQFEDRLKAILRATKAAAGNVILFIDEIHQLLGLGRTSGAMDAANLMKPALARGELWCIGATTYDEFREFEADAALRRRFQPVHVPEQDLDEVAEILARIRPGYEEHHGVSYSPESLQVLGRMARRYIGDVRSPAREVGLMDEIGAEVSLLSEEGGLDEGPVVTVDHVAEAISRRTGIPVQRMTSDRRARALSLEEALGERVFGQERVVRNVAAVVRRSLAGLSPPGQPRAVIYLAGPSGVGKTELAKALADELYDSSDAMIRLDMTEFNAETARNRLIGSDPGFVGFEQGGRLTEAVRRRPYSLVLLDEFEKAHPSVWRIFLQVFDEGRLTDAKGRVVDFSETIVVMTSNAGASLMNRVTQLHRELDELIAGIPGQGRRSVAGTVEALVDQGARACSGMPALAYQILRGEAERRLSGDDAPADEEQLTRRAILAIPDFPPELFGRIGRPFVFDTLGTGHLEQILDRLMLDLCHRIALDRDPDCPGEMKAGDPRLLVRRGAHGERTYAYMQPDRDAPYVAIRVSENRIRALVQRGYDPLIGARAMKNAVREFVEPAIARGILAGAPAGPFSIELGES